MLEKDIQNSIRNWAKSRGFLVTKNYGGPFSRVGVADLLMCYRGRYIALEIKRPPKKPTPAQMKFLEEVEEHGGYASWTDNRKDGIGWLSSIALELDRIDTKKKPPSSPVITGTPLSSWIREPAKRSRR